MPEATKKTEKEEQLVTRQHVLSELKAAIEKRFNNITEAMNSTTNVWNRHDMTIALQELKYVYENLIK